MWEKNVSSKETFEKPHVCLLLSSCHPQQTKQISSSPPPQLLPSACTFPSTPSLPSLPRDAFLTLLHLRLKQLFSTSTALKLGYHPPPQAPSPSPHSPFLFSFFGTEILTQSHRIQKTGLDQSIAASWPFPTLPPVPSPCMTTPNFLFLPPHLSKTCYTVLVMRWP